MGKILFLLLFSVVLTGCHSSTTSTDNLAATASYFETIKYAPSDQLQTFLTAMPKGADLHNHVAGATYAENLIAYNLGQGFCIDTILFATQPGTGCVPYFSLDNLATNPDVKNTLIDAWSMRNFNYATGSGHDHFFGAFAKFIVLFNPFSYPQVMREIINRAASQNEVYLELMDTPDGTAAGDLGTSVGWNSDLNVMYTNLINSGQLSSIVAQVHQTLVSRAAQTAQLMSCGTAHAEAGCTVATRYLYQVLRVQPPERVFSQFVAGFEMASQLNEFVGINLVQPEDASISLSDYPLHMQMVQFLKQKYPGVKVSLHAGELTAQFVSDSDLAFHITSAVRIARANRIGHGIDIKNEVNYQNLLQEMAANKILVEINLTSNQDILGVDKTTHPFPTYLAYQVPLALSTDDEGILRTDLTAQYMKAAQDYNLSYPTLKNLSRNSLEYSFVPGKSLWADNGAYQTINSNCTADYAARASPGTACQAFLDANEKAQLEWTLEQKYFVFEEQYSAM